ncbi:MAG TPA: c-type cytochrome [Solimonas sp.]|nr:c-type cytochrome [Solimonas sp.]
MTAPSRVLIVLTFVTALAAGCGGDKSPAPSAAAPAAAAMPSDPALAKLYSQTCMACHTKPGSGAPQAGTADWEPRKAQGMDVLLQHTVSGYKGMPPLGSCMDCGEDDFKALIRFMAQMP